jgi:hypothetical protein
VLGEWQREDREGRQLAWWSQFPPPHSALAELGRIANPDMIVAVAQLIDKAQPTGTKQAAQGIRAFRLAWHRAVDESRGQQAD